MSRQEADERLTVDLGGARPLLGLLPEILTDHLHGFDAIANWHEDVHDYQPVGRTCCLKPMLNQVECFLTICGKMALHLILLE